MQEIRMQLKQGLLESILDPRTMPYEITEYNKKETATLERELNAEVASAET